MEKLYNIFNRKLSFFLLVIILFFGVSEAFSQDCPTADAGGDQPICSTTNTILLQGVVTNGDSIIEWISDGTGSFNDPNIHNPIYTPSAADICNGTVNIILNAIAYSRCSNVVGILAINKQQNS